MSCEVCGKPSETKCAGCDKANYCSKKHQKEHWPSHKDSCLAFTIEEDSVVGRHLAARRVVARGEVVLREIPLVSGPPQITGPLCLGCYTLLQPDTAKPCTSCGWPLCSPNCFTSVHHRPECAWAELKRKAKVKISQFVTPHPTYACLLPLRCLFLRSSDPTAWKRLLSLESHSDERAKTLKNDADRFGIAQLLHRFYKLENDFTEEEILNICGIIQINGHEVPLSGNGYISIYWRGSLVEHSCIATCSKTFTRGGQLLLRAATELPQGSRLSICYTDPMWGTPHRRHHLSQSKFFWCRCPRCSDPTELGTYMTAIKCISNSDCKGKMLPPTFLVDEGQKGPDWVCGDCGHKGTEEDVSKVLGKLGRMSAKVNRDDVPSLKAFLKEAEQLVPENHYHITEMSIALAQLYGQINPGGLQGLDDASLEHKESLSRRLITLTDKIVPAECRLRGTLYFELHASVAEKTRRQASAGLIDAMEVRTMLLESKFYLEKCLDLLKYEPEVLPEGQMAEQAQENLTDLDNVLRGIHLDSPI